ncbi:hypothetical protein CXF59_10345 [Flavobacterium sp. ALD4]|nr:hypothetical protein CXF59_10345 [Flavobacterium sp. ALD4]
MISISSLLYIINSECKINEFFKANQVFYHRTFTVEFQQIMRLKINGVLCVLGVPRLRFTAARQALRCNLFIIPLSLLDKKGFPLQSFTRD